MQSDYIKENIGVGSMLSIIETLLAILGRGLDLARSFRLLGARQPSYSYENVFLDLTLDIKDVRGRRALITRKQRVRFLTDDAGVIASPIWGEGKQLERYDVRGAKRLGARADGPRKVLMLDLDRNAIRGSMATFVAHQTVRSGFIKPEEYFEAAMERPTGRLTIRVLFPRGRLPTTANLVEKSRARTEKLPIRFGRDGRARIRWSRQRPTLNSTYSLRWSW